MLLYYPPLIKQDLQKPSCSDIKPTDKYDLLLPSNIVGAFQSFIKIIFNLMMLKVVKKFAPIKEQVSGMKNDILV